MFRVRPEKLVLTVTKLYCFARQRRFGQESLSIFVRFAPNLISVHDPDSPAQRVPGSVFYLIFNDWKKYKNGYTLVVRIFSGRTTAKSAILSCRWNVVEDSVTSY